MAGTLQHARNAFAAQATRSQRLLDRAGLTLIAAALLAAGGCMTTGEPMAEDLTEANEVDSADPTLAALRDGAHATPEAVGGFCVEGVGVFLTAVDNKAELTLYVVAPAERVTFDRPALYLTSREGDHAMTEVAELDAVTLRAGESRVFQQEAQGPLMDVFADFVNE